MPLQLLPRHVAGSPAPLLLLIRTTGIPRRQGARRVGNGLDEVGVAKFAHRVGGEALLRVAKRHPGKADGDAGAGGRAAFIAGAPFPSRKQPSTQPVDGQDAGVIEALVLELRASWFLHPRDR